MVVPSLIRTARSSSASVPCFVGPAKDGDTGVDHQFDARCARTRTSGSRAPRRAQSKSPRCSSARTARHQKEVSRPNRGGPRSPRVGKPDARCSIRISRATTRPSRSTTPDSAHLAGLASDTTTERSRLTDGGEDEKCAVADVPKCARLVNEEQREDGEDGEEGEDDGYHHDEGRSVKDAPERTDGPEKHRAGQSLVHLSPVPIMGSVWTR